MVFTHELDRAAIPLASRKRGVIIGTLVMGFAAAALISPRTIPFGLPVVAVCAAALGSGREALLREWSPSKNGVLTVVAFLGLALVSMLWAAEWDAPLGPALKGSAYLLAALAAAVVMRNERRSDAFHIAEGLWIGLLAGLVYLLFEIASGQAIKLALYRALALGPGDLRPPMYFTWTGRRLDAISPFDLTRNIAPISMYLWAALLAMRSGMPSRKARVGVIAMFVLAALVIGLSEHETSKVAMAASTLIFALAYARPELSLKVLRVGWVAACLAIIPVSLALHRAGLHQATWLQNTARHRVIIWNHTAEESLKAPLLGVGAGMMYRLGSAPEKMKNPGEDFQYNVPHAHNIYLQTWFELGAAGAAILTLIGLAILERIGRMSIRAQPYAQATFASAMVMAAASYGMWQPWFIAMFAFCVTAFAIAVRVDTPGELAEPLDRSSA